MQISIEGGSDKRFTYNYVFDANSTQGEIYERCVIPLVDSSFEGYNATSMIGSWRVP